MSRRTPDRTRTARAAAAPTPSTRTIRQSRRFWEYARIRADVRSRFAGQPALAASFCQGPHAANVTGAFRHTDYAAGIEQIEQMAGLDTLVIGGQRQALCHQRSTFYLRIDKMPPQYL